MLLYYDTIIFKVSNLIITHVTQMFYFSIPTSAANCHPATTGLAYGKKVWTVLY